MARLLRDRYLWFIVAAMAMVVILLYPAATYFQDWRLSHEEWYFTYMIFQRVLLLIAVAVAAWKFGVRGGLVACLAVGLIVLPYAVGMAVGQWRPDLLVEYLIMGAIAVALSWLIGNYEKEKRLLEKSHDQLEMHVQERTTELTAVNEQLQREIIEHERTEEALGLKAELLDAATDSIFIVDLNGTITYVNETAYKSRGYSKDELIGMNIKVLDTPRYANLIEQRIRKLIEKGKITFETAHVRKDKSIMQVEVYSRIIESGGKKLIMSIARDITKRKHAEEKARELYKVEKQLRRELEKQIKQRIEFTRALVHELKTPLTPIRAASELLMAEVQEEPWQSLATKINLGVHSLIKRIDELFDMARGEIGVLKLNCKSVDSRQLLQEVCDYVAAEASGHKQSLILDLPPSLHSVWADEDRLQQVLLNLLDNAFKFTPEGGKITLKAIEKDGNMIVEVQDTGCGMTIEEQRRLFKSYHLPGVDTEHPSGLGLGLALCKSLVELHGGRIWVKSRKGKGSTFSFAIPFEKEEVVNYESPYH